MKLNTRMTTRIAITGLIIATGFAAQAATGDGEGRHGGKMRGERPSFATLDTDSNGELTKDELAAHARARFDAADENKDGMLSAEEMTKSDHKRAAKRAEKMISRHDANDDGMISFDEMSSEKRTERMGKMFDRMDADGNGTVSEEEFAKMEKKGHGKRKGKRGDADKDE